MIRAGIIGMAIVAAAWSLATPVSAYLDPGTGNALLQGIIGGVAVVTGFLAYYWNRFRGLVSFRRDHGSRDTRPNPSDQPDR